MSNRTVDLSGFCDSCHALYSASPCGNPQCQFMFCEGCAIASWMRCPHCGRFAGRKAAFLTFVFALCGAAAFLLTGIFSAFAGVSVGAGASLLLALAFYGGVVVLLLRLRGKT